MNAQPTARTYFDANATLPLRPEAREAMVTAMDVAGNPSSVHQEGRAARALVERARAQVAAAAGADPAEVVFTSGATEAAALALAGRSLSISAVEHDCVRAYAEEALTCDSQGVVQVNTPAGSALQLANSETGVVQSLPDGLALTDAVQGFGKIPFSFAWSGARMALLSAHKIGGPKGTGALLVKRGDDVGAQIRGGGQEMGRRAGTENIIGIAGFGAAAAAAQEELAAGRWEEVAALRDLLENALRDGAGDSITIAGGGAGARLPNTTCVIAPGWKGETQVMAMDLAGFAVSAGAACSSGKLRASAVLTAMGVPASNAACALRISLAPFNTRTEILRFAERWCASYKKQLARAA